MRNCRVTKNVVFGHSCRYTVYHTQNNYHLDQNIGIISLIWHKCSILVNNNTPEYNVSQDKKETIHDGAIGMTSQHVGSLKQAKNRVSD